jgi:putative FmdB family regulatory protein
MPIYEYKCEQCGGSYEQMRRMTDADRDLECPSCKSTAIKRQLSAFATTTASSSAGPSPMGGGCGKPQCGMGGCGFN